MQPLTGYSAGGKLNQLPITIIAGEATIEASLRVRLQAGTTVEVFGTGFDFELGAYVDLFEYTAVAIGESHNCGLFIAERVDLAVGVYALFVLGIDYRAFTAIPAVFIVLLELDLPNICLATLPKHHHSASGYPTLPTGTGYPTGYPTSSPSGEGYPSQSSQGYLTLPSGTEKPSWISNWIPYRILCYYRSSLPNWNRFSVRLFHPKQFCQRRNHCFCTLDNRDGLFHHFLHHHILRGDWPPLPRKLLLPDCRHGGLPRHWNPDACCPDNSGISSQNSFQQLCAPISYPGPYANPLNRLHPNHLHA